MTTHGNRYTRIAMLLHWLIAALFIGLIAVGIYMTRLGDEALAKKFALYQWHKSFGITLMLLTIIRLAWRLTHRPPALLAAPGSLAHRAATLGHIGLYGLTLLVPLAGWAMASASPYNIPTVLYGTAPWPHLPPFDTLADKATAEAVLKTLHRWLAYLAGTLALVHAAAALYHHLILRDATLVRMIPFLGPSTGDNHP